MKEEEEEKEWDYHKSKWISINTQQLNELPKMLCNAA